MYVGTTSDFWYRFHAEPAVRKHLDYAKFQRLHVWVIVSTAMGFFADSYSIFIMGAVTPMLGLSRFATEPTVVQKDGSLSVKYGGVPLAADISMKTALLCGTLVGQLLFGLLADVCGRRVCYKYALAFVAAFSVVDTLVTVSMDVPTSTFVTVFCIVRFVVGIAIGGEYPLSAVYTSEYAPVAWRGKMLGLVFMTQGLAMVTGALVCYGLVNIFADEIVQCMPGVPCEILDVAWRIALGLTAVPACLALLLRSGLPESPRFTVHVLQNPLQAWNDLEHLLNGAPREKGFESVGPPDRITYHGFMKFLCARGNKLTLLGTSLSWLLLDIAYYSQSMFLPTIMADLGTPTTVGATANGQNILSMLQASYRMRILVIMMGTMPGYLFATLMVDRMGRRNLQTLGFMFMTLLFAALAVAYRQILDVPWVFLQLYSLMFFFSNFGPNTTTFIMPAELFPTKFRGTCFGISAAAGKLGAVIGVAVLGFFITVEARRGVMAALVVVCALGIFTTLLLPEPCGTPLEELTGEDDCTSSLYLVADDAPLGAGRAGGR